MATVLAGDTPVHYKARGSGPGLVLVHGAGPGAEITYGHLVDRFTDRNTVILPDIAGSDEAEDDGHDLAVGALAEQVAAVIEGAGDAPVDLVGFSLGAPVVAAVAATRPELVRRLILIAGFGRHDEYMRNLFTTWRRLDDDAEAFGRLGAATAFSRRFLEDLGREEVEALVRNMKTTPSTLRQLELVLRLDVRDLLPRIQAETLVIGCAQDHTVPVENSRELHTAIPRSTYAEVVSGHVMMFERPDEFVTLVWNFVHGPAQPS